MTSDVITRDAYRIIPGAVYALESAFRITQAQAEEVKARFEEATGASVMVLPFGFHLVERKATP
jgi:hypothetical protein